MEQGDYENAYASLQVPASVLHNVLFFFCVFVCLCVFTCMDASMLTCLEQEAFRFFEEAGNSLKIPCLKYILLSNMLRSSKVR